MLLALSIGGDDYICKPYSLGVLLAKVKAVLKRYEDKQSSSEKTAGDSLVQLGEVQFDMKKAVINQNFHALKGKIGKIEMRIKEANSSATSKIYYTIRVANTEDRTGSGKIVENIPDNYYMIPEENSDWKIDGSKASINISEIKSGEWKEYKLIITKKDGVDISQTISNNIEILSTSFEETSLDDNKDKNDLVILPRTGFMFFVKENKIPVAIAFITLNAIALGAVIIRVRKRINLEN